MLDTVMNRSLMLEQVDRADVIFHLAAAVGVRLIVEKPVFTIYDLAVLVKQMTKSPSEIVFVPYEEAYEAGFEDMPCRVPDISKIQRLIGYEPVVDLPEMLEQVITYERERGK